MTMKVELGSGGFQSHEKTRLIILADKNRHRNNMLHMLQRFVKKW